MGTAMHIVYIRGNHRLLGGNWNGCNVNSSYRRLTLTCSSNGWNVNAFTFKRKQITQNRNRRSVYAVKITPLIKHVVLLVHLSHTHTHTHTHIHAIHIYTHTRYKQQQQQRKFNRADDVIIGRRCVDDVRCTWDADDAWLTRVSSSFYRHHRHQRQQQQQAPRAHQRRQVNCLAWLSRGWRTTSAVPNVGNWCS